MNASILRRMAARALIYLLPRACASTILVAPAYGEMVLISEARSVTVSYYGAGIETHSSAGTFGEFHGNPIGIPYGGGAMLASQDSNISPSGFTLVHSIRDFFGPGGWAESNFQVTFSLPQETRISISGFRDYAFPFGYNNPSSAVLVSDSDGVIPLVWYGDFYLTINLQNRLNFDEVLSPGVYTFTARETFLFDHNFSRLEVRASSVPDDGSSALQLAFGIFALFAIHRRRNRSFLRGRWAARR